MDIKQVLYFLSVAETGSFSIAAEELYISQSSLSKQIIALEKELDIQLFDRSKRKISLTDAGEIFRKHALELHEVYKTILDDLEEFRTTAASLSILAIPVIAQYEITSYIAQFKSTYPNINFTLEEREASAILPALNSHQYDLAFIRDNYIDKDQYAWLEISKDKLLVVASDRHPYATKTSVSLKELSNENFIMFDKGTIVHEMSMDACHRAGFDPRIFYASLRVESVIGLVASNSGIALIMEKVFEYHRHPDVVAIRLDETIESNIVLARLRSKKPSRAARVFIEFMEKTLPAR